MAPDVSGRVLSNWCACGEPGLQACWRWLPCRLRRRRAAATALPRAGVVLEGQSLGGVRIGWSRAMVIAAWGDRYARCRSCARETLYFNERPFQPQGAGVELRKGRVIAVFTLWAPRRLAHRRGLRARRAGGQGDRDLRDAADTRVRRVPRDRATREARPDRSSPSSTAPSGASPWSPPGSPRCR